MKTSSLKWLSIALAFVPGTVTVAFLATKSQITSGAAAILVDLAALLWLGVMVVYYRQTRTPAATRLFTVLLLVALPGPALCSFLWWMSSLMN
jgi:hypothetical protein